MSLLPSKANLEVDGQDMELLARAAEQMVQGNDYRSLQYKLLAKRIRETKQAFHTVHAAAFNERFGREACS